MSSSYSFKIKESINLRISVVSHSHLPGSSPSSGLFSLYLSSELLSLSCPLFTKVLESGQAPTKFRTKLISRIPLPHSSSFLKVSFRCFHSRPLFLFFLHFSSPSVFCSSPILSFLKLTSCCPDLRRNIHKSPRYILHTPLRERSRSCKILHKEYS